jgi:hypothetical protein
MIELQAEQQTFVFEGFPLELSSASHIMSSAVYNYVDGNGNFYVNGNGDFYVTGSVNSYSKAIVLDAHLPNLIFEGWING